MATTPCITKPMSRRCGVKLKDREKPEVLWTLLKRVIRLSDRCDVTLPKCSTLGLSLDMRDARMLEG